jgi:hypothetical protein
MMSGALLFVSSPSLMTRDLEAGRRRPMLALGTAVLMAVVVLAFATVVVFTAGNPQR